MVIGGEIGVLFRSPLLFDDGTSGVYFLSCRFCIVKLGVDVDVLVGVNSVFAGSAVEIVFVVTGVVVEVFTLGTVVV